jgi:putative flavoprotein involved in K+ transport
MSPGPAAAPPDVVVIGGGQAGLAMGYHLAQPGLSFQIADAGAGTGQTWRSRWDSPPLFTSGRMTTCRATSCHVARALPAAR